MEKDGIGPNYLSEDGKIMTRASHPLYLSYLTKLREWYEKGYIYKEFFVIKQPQIEDMVTADRIGGTNIWYSRVVRPFESIETADPTKSYVELPELTDATRLSRSEADAAVEAGKFIIWHDGRKFKTGRAVNSLTTLTGKSAAYQKIKIIEVMDRIREDITLTAEDQFIGKYPNSYDNRCLLLSAIKGYFESLATDGILGADPEVAMDPDANRTWLKTNGFDVSGMTEDELRQADTGSVVNLKATIRILDVIEDIELPILLNQ